jgi:hypothetical protein
MRYIVYCKAELGCIDPTWQYLASAEAHHKAALTMQLAGIDACDLSLISADVGLPHSSVTFHTASMLAYQHNFNIERGVRSVWLHRVSDVC